MRVYWNFKGICVDILQIHCSRLFSHFLMSVLTIFNFIFNRLQNQDNNKSNFKFVL